MENKLIGFADDTSLMALVPSRGFRVTAAESLIRDLGIVRWSDLWGMKLNASKIRVSEWYDLCGMKLNGCKTKTTIGSRSRTMHPHSLH